MKSAWCGDLLIAVQGDEVDYRGVLHRDGSVLMSVSLEQLKVCFLLDYFSSSLQKPLKKGSLTIVSLARTLSCCTSLWPPS